MHKITPFLWFDEQAEEAVIFYVSVFKNSKINSMARYPAEGQDVTGMKPGKLMTAAFELDGQAFVALNGGPMFKFTEAISFTVDCEDQAEVDYYWDKLVEGGSPSQCGWLKDKFGLSWQIVPRALPRLMGDPDREKAGRVMKAMLTMSKIDVAALQAAYDQA